MVEWTGVILAGGIGSRLRPITADRPKPLVPVVGKPMIVYAIDLLRYAGVTEIIVVVRHMGDQIRKFLADKDFRSKVNNKLSESHKLNSPDEKPNPSEYEVVFAIISSSPKELEIPFFSKVSLRNIKRRLETFGYKVSLQKIGFENNN